MHPLYKFLTEKDRNGYKDSSVKWNFQKYLIDKDGFLVKIVSPRVNPDDPVVLDWIKSWFTMKNKKGLNTRCIHDGELKDDKFKGAVSPLYLSTAYDYLEVVDHKYPRYFNTPNQLALSKKISSLENCEKSLIFGSGIAAIFASMFSFLKTGDHVVFQSSLYGGTINLILKEFKKFNIEHTLVESLEIEDYKKEIKRRNYSKL